MHMAVRARATHLPFVRWRKMRRSRKKMSMILRTYKEMCTNNKTKANDTRAKRKKNTFNSIQLLFSFIFIYVLRSDNGTSVGLCYMIFVGFLTFFAIQKSVSVDIRRTTTIFILHLVFSIRFFSLRRSLLLFVGDGICRSVFNKFR